DDIWKIVLDHINYSEDLTILKMEFRCDAYQQNSNYLHLNHQDIAEALGLFVCGFQNLYGMESLMVVLSSTMLEGLNQGKRTGCILRIHCEHTGNAASAEDSRIVPKIDFPRALRAQLMIRALRKHWTMMENLTAPLRVHLAEFPVDPILGQILLNWDAVKKCVLVSNRCCNERVCYTSKAEEHFSIKSQLLKFLKGFNNPFESCGPHFTNLEVVTPDVAFCIHPHIPDPSLTPQQFRSLQSAAMLTIWMRFRLGGSSN
ncbi:8945_t:CDS:2, partial [Paraglomus brasilianum]